MEAAEAELHQKNRKVYFKMRNYQLADLCEGSFDEHKQKIDVLEGLLEDFVLSVEETCDKYEGEMGPERSNQWKALIPQVERDFAGYRRGFLAKLSDLAKSKEANVQSFQSAQLKLMQESNEISRRNQQAAVEVTTVSEDSKKAIAVKKAKAKIEAIHADAEVLGEDVNCIEDWTKESDLSISKSMRKISEWKKSMEKLVTMGREFTEFVASNNLCDEDVDIVGTDVMVESVVREVKETVKSVEEEDLQRRLFSLDTSSADKVKLPTFEGKDEEDFQKFKEEIEKAFDTNRVSRADQLTKLRESLRGQAKRMVPESITEDIGKAWEALEKAFGKPLILMSFRRDLIKKLGPIPKINRY